MNFPRLQLIFAILMAAAEVAESSPPQALGYIAEVPPETAAAREVRHQKIASRRAGNIVMVHRGASAMAPENTLEAYATAMDYGADGCEIDLRRTADGVLVLFHDDMLDHLTDGFGSVRQVSYYELLLLQPRFIYGTANRQTRPPTFAAVLALAQQRAMVLHLDIKESGLEEAIIAMLDAADMWDHIVSVNSANATKLRLHPKLKLLSYKIGGLYEERRDVDPEAIREALARPGNMIMVDDPRTAARQLKRTPYAPVPLPRGIRSVWNPVDVAADESFNPARHVKLIESRPDLRSTGALMGLLNASFPERAEPQNDPATERRLTERIVERAWAAQRLGQVGRKSHEVLSTLEGVVKSRSLHRDWLYHGLDGAMAIRALENLGAVRSVPAMIQLFRSTDLELKKVANADFSQYPLSWTDFRTKMYILPALGELRSAGSKEFLFEYLALDEAKAREMAPLQFEEATKALLRHKLTSDELKGILESRHRAARGTAILLCVDHPTRIRTTALKTFAPWALELPKAKHAL